VKRCEGALENIDGPWEQCDAPAQTGSDWSDMYQNVADFECGEGPFEDKPDTVMCEECDGPVLPGDKCPACGVAN
jgi:hypothetical protein